jgi:uncharacterized repeat protein (TIGR02543 family)
MPAENQTITAKWSINEYTITFNTDGGTAIAPITQDYGTAVTAPANPTKTGYTFAGWDKTIPGTMPAENITITAQWTINQYTITFDTDGGNTIEPITQDYGTDVAAPENPTKTGYRFVGWDKDIPATMPAADMTIKAKWSINQYILTINRNDNTYGTVSGAGGYDYNTAAAINATANYGYKFVEWRNANGQISTTASTTVTVKSDTTITAIFEPVNFLVTANSDAQGTAAGSGNYTYKTSATVVATPSYGYKFKNWTNEADEVVSSEAEFEFTVVGDTTLTAHYDPITYTVTVNNTTGGSATGAGDYDYNEPAILVATPATGYHFMKWTSLDKDNNAVQLGTNATLNFTVTRDTTITANYEINSYTVTATSNGNGTTSGSATYTYGQTATLTATPNACYRFVNWTTGAGDVYSNAASIDINVTDNVTLYANFEKIAYELILAAGANGKVTNITAANEELTASTSKTYDYECGDEIQIKAEPNYGYKFVEWQNADGSRYSTDATTTVTMSANTKLTATFTELDYTVTANSDAQGSATGSGSYKYLSNATVVAAPIYGYQFKNWTNDNGDEVSTSASYTFTVTSDITLTAHYDAKTYTVTTNKTTGGETVTGGGSYVYNTEADLAATAMTGYHFVNWTSLDKDNNAVQLGTETSLNFTVTRDTTITANFEPNTYTVTFNVNGGAGETMAAQAFTYNVAQNLSANTYTREGYTFDGWALAADDAVAHTDQKSVINLTAENNGTVELFAHWKPINYTVTVNGGTADKTTANIGDEITLTFAGKTGYNPKDWTTTPALSVENNKFTMPAANVVVTANYTPKTYTVTLNNQGATTSGSTTIEATYDAALQDISVPTKAGYTFEGYYSAENGAGNKYYNGTGNGVRTWDIDDASATLYANWNINKYTITYMVDGVQDGDVEEYDFNALVTMRTEPTKVGYTFSHWSETITNMPAENKVITGTFSVNQYNATWMMNDGTTNTYTAQPTKFDYGTAITAPEGKPTRTGYEFKGWSRTSNASAPDESLGTMSENGETFYAVWAINTYLLTWNINTTDATATFGTTSYTVGNVTFNDPIVKPAPTRTGWSFKYWMETEAGSEANVPATMPAKPLTYYAYWEINKHNLTWHENSPAGSTAIFSGDYTQGNEVAYGTEIVVPTANCTGYTLVGWATSANGEVVDIDTRMPDADVTYYAIWAEASGIPYTVRHMQQNVDKTAYVEESTETKYGTTNGVTEAIAKTFDGFTALAITQGTIAADGSTVVEVKYDRKDFKLTWDFGNGTTTQTAGTDYTDAGSVTFGAALTAPTLTRTGYKNPTWSPEVPATMPAADATYTTVWTPNKYHVAFDNNGGVGEMGNQEFTFDVAQNLTANAFTKTGYHFTEWKDADDASKTYTDNQEVKNLTTVDGATITLKAQWKANNYTIVYNGNGATSGSIVNQLATYDQDVDIADNANATDYKRTGYTFNNWNTKANGTGTTYSATQSPKPQNLTSQNDGEVTLYAQWTVNTYTATWMMNDGSGETFTTSTFEYGAPITAPTTNPSRTGYTFLGWHTEYDATAKLDDLGTMPVDGITFYAVWTEADGIQYIVRHMWQNVDDDDYAVHETETKSGTTNAQTVAAAKEYDGFTVQTFAQKQIAADGSTVVDIYYNRNNYNLAWTLNGGTATNTYTAAGSVRFGKALTKPELEREGYDVYVWQPEVPATMPAGDATYEAVWTPNTYYVVFNSNSGTGAIERQTFTFDVSQKLAKNDNLITKEGYTFTGWNTAADGNGNPYADEQEVENLTSVKGATITLYAQWKANKYTIVYNGNHTGVTGNTQSTDAEYDQTVTIAANGFNVVGYTFNNWNTKAEGDGTSYAAGATPKNLTNEPNGIFNLYAQWTVNQYTVTWMMNDGTDDVYTTEPTTFNYGATITAPDGKPSRTGYDFVGWSKNRLATAKDESLGVMSENGETFYAVWTEADGVKYIVRHMQQNVDDDNYTEFETDEKHGKTNAQTAASANTYVGFTAQPFNQTSIAADGSTVVEINYNRNNYTLAWTLNGGTATNTYTAAGSVRYGKALTKPELEREGYDVYSWQPDVPATMPAGDATYEAVWTPNTYKVAFHNNTGSGSMTPQEFNYDEEKALTANTFTKTGYTFAGWVDANDATKTYTDGQKVKNLTSALGATIDLNAQWDANKYTVVYYGNHANVTGSMTSTAAEYDVDVTIANNGFNLKGHSFLNWNTNADGTGKTFEAGDVDKNLTAEPNGKFNLYAQWKANKYKATWMMNNGTADKFTETEVEYDTNITAPIPEPSREGYTFAGWSTSASALTPDSDLGTMDDDGETFYAVWTTNKYLLAWNVNAGDDATAKLEGTYTPNGMTVFGTNLVAPSATRHGYTFKGWSETQNGSTIEPILDKMPARALSYYAKWDVNKHTLTWNINSPSNSAAAFESDDYTKGSTDFDTTINAPSVSCVGYVFKGWTTSLDGDVVEPQTTMPDEDLTYYAKWEEAEGIKYIVRHYMQNVDDDNYTYTDEEKTGTTNATTAAVAKTVAGFASQNFTQGTIAPNGSTIVEIYYNRNNYTLTWEVAGGTIGSAPYTAAGSVRYGKALTAPSLTRTGYDVYVWSPEVPATMPAGDKTYTAVWTANTYEVVFNANTGKNTMPNQTFTVDVPQDLNENTFEKEGYTFTKWNTQADGNGTSYNDKQRIDVNLTTTNNAAINLYAQWAPNTYTIKYIGNKVNVTGATEPQVVTYDQNVTIATNGFNLVGYTFRNWNTQPDGGGVTYNEGDEKKNLNAEPNGEFKLYAQWRINKYDAVWMMNDGTNDTYATTRFDFDAQITAPDGEPTREGHTFQGWSKNQTATAADSELGTMDDGGETFYAVWTTNQYEIVWDKNATDAVLSGDYSSGSIYFGTNIRAPKAERTGYTLRGWSETQAGGTIEPIETTMPARNLHYYAQWNVNTHVLTWDPNSPANSTATLSGDYTKGNVAFGTPIDAPTAECVGYKFMGWATSKDSEVAPIAEMMPDKDVTYYAIWEARDDIQYIVRHYKQNVDDDLYTEVEADRETKTGTTNGLTSAAAKSYSGFTAQDFAQAEIAPNGSTVVDIYYDRNSYTLTWNYAGGEEGSATFTPAGETRFGKTLTAPKLTREGYDKYVWNPSVPATMPAAHSTYTAVWTPNTYKVAFNNNGGSGTMTSQAFTYDEAQDLKVNTFTREGYTFAGWAETNNDVVKYADAQNVKNLTSINDATVTLYAVWSAIDYTVTVNYGTSNKTTANIGETISLTPNTVTGCTFNSWNVVTEAGNAVTMSGNSFVMPAANVIATASYDTIYYKVTVSDGAKTDVATAKYQQVVTLDHDAKPGFNFTGWTVTDANSNEIIVNGGKFTMPASDVTVKANYVAIQYIITVDNGTADKNEAPMGEAVTITANAPADGYEFDYWEITNGEGASMNNANASSTILRVGTSNVNVRANYRLVDYTITVNNGTANKTTANMNELVTITANNPAIGYEFTGWTLVSGTGAQITSVTSNETTITVGTGNVEVTANYQLVEYTITVHGGTANYTTATYETTVSLTADDKLGYTFDDWVTEPNVNVTFTNTFVMPASDIDVTAKFIPNEYTIEYVNNGGVGTTVDQDATYDQDVTILSNTGFTKAGYEFISWNTQPDGSGATYYPGSTQKNLATEGTITLYAQWEIAGFIITFNNNGGKGSMATQQINYDVWDYLSKCTFTKTGYKFAGWNLKADGTAYRHDGKGINYEDEEYVSNITAGEAVTLYAQWKPVDYYVAFDGNADDVTGSMDNQLFRFDDAEPLNTNNYTRTGYTFTGWNRNSEGTSVAMADGEKVVNLSSTENDVVRLYAQWTANTYTITFKKNDGTGQMDDMTMTYGVEASLTPNAFTREGYVFSGWATSADGKGTRFENKQTVKNLVGDKGGVINLYAQWSPITYTIVYNANNSQAVGSTETQTFTYDVAQTLNANGYTVDGYSFKGWATTINGEVVYLDKQNVYNITTTPDAIINLYAVWTANMYYVVFDGNGSTSGSMSKQTLVFDEAKILNANAYVRSGYNFNGWNTAADGSGTAYIDKAVVYNLTNEANVDVTLYAQWKPGVYTITTDDYSTSDVASATMGTKVTVTPLYREGYNFVGWSTKPTNLVINDDNTFEMPASDVVINTIFNTITYTITYNIPDGVENSNRTLYTIVDDDIKLEDVYRSGYIFQGWFNEIGDQVTVIPSGSTGNITLTAKWKADIEIECIDSKPFITWNSSDYTQFVTCENEESIVVDIPTPQGTFINCNGKVFTGEQIMRYVNYTFFVNGVKMQSDTINTFTLPDEGIPSKGIVDVAVSLLEDTATCHISYEIRRRFITIMWNDVISVINTGEYTEDGKLFAAGKYEWYHQKLGETEFKQIDGVIAPYYCEDGGLTGTYYLIAYTEDGTKYRSCDKVIGNQLVAQSLVAYPNPSAGIVNVKGGTWDVGDAITVVNESGQTVITRTAESATKDKVDLSGLPQGTYVIRIGNDVVSVIKR